MITIFLERLITSALNKAGEFAPRMNVALCSYSALLSSCSIPLSLMSVMVKLSPCPVDLTSVGDIAILSPIFLS